VIVTVILDEEDEMIGEPWCEVRGLPEIGASNAPLVDALEEDLGQFIGRADQNTITNDDKLEDAIKRIARQTCQTEIGKKPEVSIVISRLM
jgi:ribonuclease J